SISQAEARKRGEIPQVQAITLGPIIPALPLSSLRTMGEPETPHPIPGRAVAAGEGEVLPLLGREPLDRVPVQRRNPRPTRPGVHTPNRWPWAYTFILLSRMKPARVIPASWAISTARDDGAETAPNTGTP